MARIWNFEQQFVEACSNSLDEVLELLGCDVTHDVFLVGIDFNSGEVAVVPDDALVTSDELQQELGSVCSDYTPFPDNHSLPEREWRSHFDRHEKSRTQCGSHIRSAVTRIARDTGNSCSVSPCFELHGYVVSIIAVYQTADYERYSPLSLDMRVLTELGRTPSLLFSVIEAVLNKFSDELRKRDAGGRYEIDPPSPRSILRAAAAHFTNINTRPERRFSYPEKHLIGFVDVYDACNVISVLSYESQKGVGGIIVAQPDNPAIDTVIRFQTTAWLIDYSKVRKLLEICKRGMCLLSDSRFIWGVGTFNDDQYEASRFDVFKIQFVGHYRWEMWHREQHLMTVENGQPKLPHVRVDVRSRLKQSFPAITDEAIDRIARAVLCAAEQKHGSTIVISASARDESTRLSVKGSRIHPFFPDERTLPGMTSIDGAIMIDLEGKCHGIGLILDGTAGDGENASRGARFNSAVRYTRGRSDRLGIVVSEDGMIDVLPDSSRL